MRKQFNIYTLVLVTVLTMLVSSCRPTCTLPPDSPKENLPKKEVNNDVYDKYQEKVLSIFSGQFKQEADTRYENYKYILELVNDETGAKDKPKLDFLGKKIVCPPASLIWLQSYDKPKKVEHKNIFDDNLGELYLHGECVFKYHKYYDVMPNAYVEVPCYYNIRVLNKENKDNIIFELSLYKRIDMSFYYSADLKIYNSEKIEFTHIKMTDNRKKTPYDEYADFYLGTYIK